MQRLCATVHVHKTEVAWPQHGQAGWAGFGSLEWRLGQCSPLDQRHFIQHPSTRRASLPVTPPLLFLLLPVVTHCRSQHSRFAARALGLDPGKSYVINSH